MAGSRQHIERNTRKAIAAGKAAPRSRSRARRDIHLLDNILVPIARGTQAIEPLVGPKADRIHFAGNEVAGPAERAVQNQAGPRPQPRAPRSAAAGRPAHIPQNGAAHLGPG